MIAKGMQSAGLSKEASYGQFWVLDHKGLITKERSEGWSGGRLLAA